MSEDIRSDTIAITPRLKRQLRWVAKARKMTGPEALVNDLLASALKQMCPHIEQLEEEYSRSTLEAYNKAIEGI